MNSREGQFLGNYELLHLIGQGSFAEVYVGRQRYIETIVAIKMLQRIGPEANESFRREARTIAHLQHPHIVHIYDFGINEDQTPYLVMEYTPIGSLRAAHPKGSRLPSEQVVAYVKQIASALDYAHQQRVIHRDIKPENILLNARREVLLSDFGIAVVLRTMDSLATQNQAGTPLYMAPEQIRAHPVPASDQYALGVMVYEWLCGEPPFRGTLFEVFTQHLYQAPPPLSTRVPDLPTAVESVVFTALAKDPQQRFSTLQNFASALETACVATRPLFPPQPFGESAKRPKVLHTNRLQPEGSLPTSPISMFPTSIPSAPPNVPPSAHESSAFAQRDSDKKEDRPSQSASSLVPEPAGAITSQTTLSRSSKTLRKDGFRAPLRSLFGKRLVFVLVTALVLASSLTYFLLSRSAADPQRTYDTLVQQPTNLTFRSPDWVVSSPKLPSPQRFRCTFDSVSATYTAAIIQNQQADFPGYYSTYCWNQAVQYRNFLYQVDVRIDRGSCGGLLFRLTQSTLQVGGQPSGYYIGICPNWSQHQGGTCQFFVYTAGDISESDQSCQGIMNNGGKTDTLAILGQNDTLSIFINKKFAFARKDTRYSTGYIAVVVASNRPPTTLFEQAKFTNLNVWTLPDSA